jgi:hypothetical protein
MPSSFDQCHILFKHKYFLMLNRNTLLGVSKSLLLSNTLNDFLHAVAKTEQPEFHLSTTNRDQMIWRVEKHNSKAVIHSYYSDRGR